MLLFGIHGMIIFVTIVITTAWTFIFTCGFLRRNLRRNRDNLNQEVVDSQKHIYSKKIMKLIGIFGALIFFALFSRLPYLVLIVIARIFGVDAVPHEAYATAFVIFLFNNVATPMIQIYFRKDLFDALKKIFCCICSQIKRRACLTPPSIVTPKVTYEVQHVDERKGNENEDTMMEFT